jgi:hypothetical protein
VQRFGLNLSLEPPVNLHLYVVERHRPFGSPSRAGHVFRLSAVYDSGLRADDSPRLSRRTVVRRELFVIC